MTTNFGGVSGHGAIAGCHCGVPLLGAIVGCHCSVLWLGGVFLFVGQYSVLKSLISTCVWLFDRSQRV